MPAENDHTTIQCYLLTLSILALAALIAGGINFIEGSGWGIATFFSPSYASTSTPAQPLTEVSDPSQSCDKQIDMSPKAEAVQIYD